MNRNTRKLAAAAVVAAVYAAATMLLAPISYGALQFRISEVLCILPFFVPCTAWGLFVGCAIANLISVAGPLDVVFGSLATLLAALCTAAVGKPWRETGRASWGSSMLACAFPVLFNAVIIGAVLAWTLAPREAFWQSFLLFGAEVGAGEAAVLFVLGLPLLRALPRSRAVSAYFARLQ